MDITFSSNVDDIQEDIDLYRALLDSLDDNLVPDANVRREEINRTLDLLEMRLKDLKDFKEKQEKEEKEEKMLFALSQHQPTPLDGHFSPSPQSRDLPGRKRHQGYLEVEIPEAKSRRHSPSGAATPRSSIGSSSSSDVEFLGSRSISQAGGPSNAPFSALFDQGKGQSKQLLESDAALARRLQAEIDRENRSSSSSQRLPPRDSYTQSFLRADGTINRYVPRQSGGLSLSPGPASWDAKVKSEVPQSRSSLQSPTHHFTTETPIYPFPGGRIKSETPTYSFPQDRIKSETPMYSFPGSQIKTETPTNTLSASRALYIPKMEGVFSPSELARRQIENQPPTAYNRPLGSTGYVYAQPASTTYSHGMVPTTFDPSDPSSYPWHMSTQDRGPTLEQTEEQLKNLMKQIRPDEELTAEERSQIPDGLKISLMKHQAAGVAWMKRMEESTTRGGILADDMGLGKTIQTIALMLARPPPPQGRQPTLIVAPLALLRQWKEELAKFVEHSHRFNVLILHGPSRPTKWSVIRAFDVIITTYSTLAAELKRKLAFQEKQKFDHLATPRGKEEFPLLGDQTVFHRVVLDEAQNIKNKSTKSALAACSLRSTHRWCLTGTPMQNSTDEMYSLIKFCRIPPYNDYERFRRHFIQPLRNAHTPQWTRDRAMERLQALLKSIMLRRNKKSEIDGKPILQLPPKTTVEERAFFDKDQLNFYRALESKAQIQFNKYVRAGTVGRNYSNALVLLLRLRQACCHPHLITNAADFALAMGNIAEVNFKKNAKALAWDVVVRLKADIEQSEAIECPVCMDADDNPSIFPCGHALCVDCLTRLTDNMLNDNGEASKPTCPHCRAAIDSSKITNLISFLKVYWPEHERDDGDTTDNSESNNKRHKRNILLDESNSSSPSSSRSASATRRKKGKGRVKGSKLRLKGKSLAELRKEALKSKTAKKKYLKKLAKDYVPSAKIEKTLALLEEIKAAGKGTEKTIIFSSFTSFLDLLEVPLSAHPDFSVYTRYDGSMGRQDREAAVHRFRENPDCKVMLISLKAGNAGLNLTVANHVIILDPFWNPFVEFQAADRCYRIGQTKEVTIHRILIGHDDGDAAAVGPSSQADHHFTVEDRIIRLQEKKRKLVEMALDERAGERIGRLGQRELGYLFGVNRLD
ncbi:hypothetical protein DV738_g3904, partial [Chaetothyriales sp. CBS 135597]